MAHITEHHSEEEREGHERNNNWISFFISWDTICIDDQLPDSGKLIGSEHGWWCDLVSLTSVIWQACGELEAIW